MELIDGFEEVVRGAEVTACTDKTLTISFGYERKANTWEEREVELAGPEIEEFVERRGYSYEDWSNGNDITDAEQYEQALLETLTDWWSIDLEADETFESAVLDQLEAA